MTTITIYFVVAILTWMVVSIGITIHERNTDFFFIALGFCLGAIWPATWVGAIIWLACWWIIKIGDANA